MGAGKFAGDYFNNRSVFHTSTNGNSLRKKDLERLNTRTGRIGSSPLRNEGIFTIQTNADLKNS